MEWRYKCDYFGTQVARIVGVAEQQRRIMGVESGLELITLPHGRQLRQDLLERYSIHSMHIIVEGSIT